jgi:hypothetical protein
MPRVVAEPPSSAQRDHGFVTAAFAEGTLLLRDEQDNYLRLEWGSASQPATDARRALPPGSYELTGYRITRRDDNGVAWFVAATGHAIQRIQIRSGQTTAVKVGDAVQFQLTARRRGQAVVLQTPVAGDAHAGLSVYRDGRRITLRYRVTDADGRELAAGDLRYG